MKPAPEELATGDLEGVEPLTDEELALEALAHGRDDLADAVLAAMLAEEEGGRAKIAQARALSIDVGLALSDAVPKEVDVQALVTNALAACPPAPSRRSLVWGSVLGVLATVGLVPLAVDLPSAGRVLDIGQLVVALFRAVDRLVDGVPGGWSLVSLGLGLGLTLVLLPARVIARRLAPAAALLFVMSAGLVHAQRFEGDWPSEDSAISVEVVDVPRSEALRRVAEVAGLGVVVRLDDDPRVTLRAHDVPVRDALRGLLDDSHEVRREGRTFFVRVAAPSAQAIPAEPMPQTEPMPLAEPVAPAPPAAPEPPAIPRSERPIQEERRTFGGNVTVRSDERVRSVATFGGNVDVAGEVVENVVTVGGNVVVREGAVVRGDVMTTGGNVHVHRGGEVQGRMITTGGEVEVADGAHVEHTPLATSRASREEASTLRETLSSAVKHALLFLLGLLLIGVFRERHANLARVMVERPTRTALVGFLGMVGAIVLTIVLVVTLIGIPGAVVVGMGTFLAVYAGIAVTASVLGAVLPFRSLGGRPVAQLAVGILVLFLLSLVPIVGGVVGFVVASLGLGAMLTTRFGARGPTHGSHS